MQQVHFVHQAQTPTIISGRVLDTLMQDGHVAECVCQTLLPLSTQHGAEMCWVQKCRCTWAFREVPQATRYVTGLAQDGSQHMAATLRETMLSQNQFVPLLQQLQDSSPLASHQCFNMKHGSEDSH